MENSNLDPSESKREKDDLEKEDASTTSELKMPVNIEAYGCLMLLGIGSLLPYNFFITPELFWQEKLATNETTGGQLNWMQNFWQNFLALGRKVVIDPNHFFSH